MPEDTTDRYTDICNSLTSVSTQDLEVIILASIEELQILNQVLEERSMGVIVRSGITEDHFTVFKEPFKFIKDFTKVNGQVPTLETVLNKFDTFESVEVENENVVVEALKEDWLHRQFKPILISTAEQAGNKLTTEALQYVKLEATRLLKHSATSGKGYSYTGMAQERLNNYLEIHGRDPNEILGLTTGFLPLDLAVNGLEFGAYGGEVDYFLVFAPTNMGKTLITSFMVQASWWSLLNNPDSNIYPAYFSLEQRASEIAHNWDNILAGVSKLALTRGTMTGEQKDKYADFIDRIQKVKKDMVIYDIKSNGGKPYTVDDIRRVLEAEGHTNFTLDQLSKVHATGSFGDVRQKIFGVSAGIREMILDLGVPGYVVAQATRDVAKRFKNDDTVVIESEDVGEAYAIVQDASKGISIAKTSDDTFRVNVIKTRNNGSGQNFLVKYVFDNGCVEVVAEDQLDQHW